MIVIKVIFFIISLIASIIFLGLSGDEITIATKPSGYWLSPVPYLLGFVLSCIFLVQSILLF